MLIYRGSERYAKFKTSGLWEGLKIKERLHGRRGYL